MALDDNSVSLDCPELKKCEKLAIVMGTEGDGLSQHTIAACDYTVKIPMALKSDRQAIQGCIKTCNVLDPSKLRLVRIKNTLALDEIEVSEALLPTVAAHPHMEVVGAPYELKFDADGNLF